MRTSRITFTRLARTTAAAAALAVLAVGCGSSDETAESDSPDTDTSSSAPAAPEDSEGTESDDTGESEESDDGGDNAPAGSAADAPTDADLETFCTTFATGLPAGSEDAAEFNTFGADLIATGTPSDLSAEGREGWELFADFLATVEDDEVADLAGSEPSDVFGDDTPAVEAFTQEFATLCAPSGSGTTPTP